MKTSHSWEKWMFCLLLTLVACKAPALGEITSPTIALPAATASPVSTFFTPTSSPTAARPVPTRQLTPTPGLRLCSPFPGYNQADLVEAISNPFNPPPPGSDDPHQAVDLAVQQNGMALAGSPVQAVLGGQVAGVIEDRFPYGNALFVEIPLEEVPLVWQRQLQAPTLAPTLEPSPVLTCPAITPLPDWDFERRSLYLLYAHLGEKPAYKADERIECGATIGSIGQSGNALNPHLHLEVRIGPAGARWKSMAHYETRATAEEMFNYCTWRVSGTFQLVDPMRLLSLLP